MPSHALSSLDLQVLYWEVLGGFFFLSVALGFISQRTHFCTMGAIADVYLMGEWTRARQWMISVCIAMLGFGVLCLCGLIDPTKTLYYTHKWSWASCIVGGIFFGIGMILASGCGLKSIVRAGEGNLKSLVVLLVMAIFAFSTLKGFFGVLRVESLDKLYISMPLGANWASLLIGLVGESFGSAHLFVHGVAEGRAGQIELWWYSVIGICSAFVLLALVLAYKKARQSSLILTGLCVGLIFVCIWWFGASLGYVAESPDTLDEIFIGSKSGRSEALSFVAPVAYLIKWFEFFSDSSNVLSTGVVSVIGVFTGSCLSALISRSFSWESFTSVHDTASHLLGAAFMGVGGVCAMGCSVGQGISGMSTLSLNALTTLISIVMGAWICLVFQSKRA
jgi:uncharacterized protein